MKPLSDYIPPFYFHILVVIFNSGKLLECDYYDSEKNIARKACELVGVRKIHDAQKIFPGVNPAFH